MVEMLSSPATTRRGDTPGAPLPAVFLAAMLDEVDYGMLLVDAHGNLLHANRAAWRDLDGHHPLWLQTQAGRPTQALAARAQTDAPVLQTALADAAWRQRRCLLSLGSAPHTCCLAVVPLPAGADAVPPVLLLLGRQKVCEDLSVDNFARACHLTMAETQVLKGLCAGLRPQDIARRQGVALSTVRTQIGCIRSKTGASSMRELLAQVARLPPMVTALHAMLSAPLAA